MHTLSRRGFLAASAALAAPLFLPRGLRAETPPRLLRATTRTLDIGGRAVSVKGILNEQGTTGLILDPGEAFRVELTAEDAFGEYDEALVSVEPRDAFPKNIQGYGSN